MADNPDVKHGVYDQDTDGGQDSVSGVVNANVDDVPAVIVVPPLVAPEVEVIEIPIVAPVTEVIEILNTSDESTVDLERTIAETVRRAAQEWRNECLRRRRRCLDCNHLAIGLTCCHCGNSFVG